MLVFCLRAKSASISMSLNTEKLRSLHFPACRVGGCFGCWAGLATFFETMMAASLTRTQDQPHSVIGWIVRRKRQGFFFWVRVAVPRRRREKRRKAFISFASCLAVFLAASLI